MKKNLLAVSLLAVAAVSAHAIHLKAGAIAWAKAYPSAKAKSASTGKLMMIDFYTDWCVWCKKLDSDVYPKPTVVDASAKFVPVKLNAEKDADGIRLAKKFKIDGYPTILFLDGNENLVYKVVGYQEAKDFTATLDKAAAIPKDLKSYNATLAKNPKDVKALLGLSGLDASIGKTDEALTLLGKAEPNVDASNKGLLLDTYNAVGDSYQNAQKMDQAIPYFTKAIDPAFPKQAAYARISIAVCLLQSGKTTEAKPYLEDLVKMGPAGGEYVAQAQQILKQIGKQ